MFRNRTSSLKPDSNFISSFRQKFPELSSTAATTSSGNNSGETSLDGVAGDESVSATASQRHTSVPHEGIVKDLDPTPKAHNEPWRFTPSLMDPNSFAFSHFANQPPGYYTPTPGGTNTLYHNQAGDLHTPMGMGLQMGLGTPLSMPTLDHGVHATSGMMEIPPFHGQHMHPQQFQNYNPFGHEHHHQTSFAPSSFVHQDTGYETMEHEGSMDPMDEDERMGSINSTMNNSPLMTFEPQSYNAGLSAALPTSAEKFRFHVTLNAPTAMIKTADEIPVTYLNKGQAYSVSIIDTAPMAPLPPGTRYRTFVRISFEDEQQRQRPAFCWGLWKEGRGTNEAHQRGGKLQAVEYVEAQPLVESDDRTRVDLDTASFDGFSVIWTPGVSASPECHIAVRFNFLSTDFSHSKGVKGIPVRLCAKTEIVTSGSPRSGLETAEVAFCKVKLFRDHGAERKLSNDIAHVKKTIDKLKQQISQVESGMKDFGKRKRGSVAEKAVQPSQRPGKVQKHKRTWSMSSVSSAGGGRPPLEEDLHFKLQTLQDMFTSTRPVSILYLRGLEQDDPDLHPVVLAGEPMDLTKVTASDSLAWQHRASGISSTTGSSSLVSPSPSSVSIASQAIGSSQWTARQPAITDNDAQSTPQQLASPPDQLTRIPTRKGTDGASLSGWIEALGVDSSYKPPPERATKPVACFYVLHREANNPTKHEYYRAIYLPQRTLKDFTRSIATKWNIDPSKIFRTLHILPRGLEIEVDDDVIRELAEGQDIIMEIGITQTSSKIKAEWEMDDVNDAAVDSFGGGSGQDVVHTDGYELRLMF